MFVFVLGSELHLKYAHRFPTANDVCKQNMQRKEFGECPGFSNQVAHNST